MNPVEEQLLKGMAEIRARLNTIETREYPARLPVLTSDPVSPVFGEAWILREPGPSYTAGMPVGLLLALTGTRANYQRKLSVMDFDGIHRIDFDS